MGVPSLFFSIISMRFFLHFSLLPLVLCLPKNKDIMRTEYPADPKWLDYCDTNEIMENDKKYDSNCDYWADHGWCPKMELGICCKSCRRMRHEKSPLWREMCERHEIYQDTGNYCSGAAAVEMNPMYSSCLNAYSVEKCCKTCRRDHS